MAMYWRKCPHCGKTYSHEGDTGLYGSPLKVCHFCGKPFIDRGYREIAVSGVRITDYIKMVCRALFFELPLAIFGCGVTVYFLFDVIKGEIDISSYWPALLASVGLGALGVWLIIKEVGYIRNFIDMVKYERTASERRLANKEYAETLKQLGFNVPKKFLE